MNVLLKIILVVIFLAPSAQADDKIKLVTDPLQRLDARYRLFKTANMWNFLELDTLTGRVWQVQFTVEDDNGRMTLPINDKPLVVSGKSGRFTLYPTENMWNFILVDQDEGGIWQVQFSVGKGGTRGIFSIP